MNVDIFIPCFVDQISPHTGIHMTKVLRKLGCNVHYNPNQTCCGQPAYNSGFVKEARSIATKFIKDFKVAHPVVSPSGSCTGYVRNFYPKMFQNTPEHSACRQTKEQLFEFAEYVVDTLDYKQLKMKNNIKVTYHDGCGALRECKIKAQPRKLLEQIEGLELIEMKECETCCGFGGTFAVKFEPISTGMAYTKVHSAIDTGATHIVSSDFSCLLHLNAYIEKHHLPIKTIHIVDLMYQSLVD
jgi:L-lactate dehydrogenase complex protein LldE